MHSWQLTIDSNDPARMVAFWAPLLNYRLSPAPDGFDTWNDYYRSVGVPEEELDADGDGCDRIHDPEGRGPNIWFQIVPETKSIKNRFHFDIYVADRQATPYAERKRLADAKVAELLDRGASVRSRSDDPVHEHFYIVMLDPEGNEFCVA